MPTTDETGVLEDEDLVCSNCGGTVPADLMVTSWSGQVLHPGDSMAACSAVCEDCGYRHDTRQMMRTASGDLVCEDCAVTCMSCSDSLARRYSINVYGDTYCPHCVRSCSRCGDYFTDPDDYECTSCREDGSVRGLIGYQRTAVHTWLGGPVPQDPDGKRVGYYLGFELEVSAYGGDVVGLRGWAERHLGPDTLEFKEDSSVYGFEIATQPMTPEFFESVDWESFFRVLNADFPHEGEEPVEHGLHVHIGRQAFQRDDVAMAAYCYLLGQSNHLERIGRRDPTHYCDKVDKPVTAAIASLNRGGVQWERARWHGHGRDAINLTNSATIEIRAFRSTRSASELRDAVRVVYVAAEYIRALRNDFGGLSPKALHWSEFCRWAGVHHPKAFRALTGDKTKVAIKG